MYKIDERGDWDFNGTMGIIWRPGPEWLQQSNVSRLMRQNGIHTYSELIAWSTADIGRFWEACVVDLGIEWDRPYKQVYDDSAGFPWTKWFVGGELNIVRNCLDRHARNEPDAMAVIWEGDDGTVRRYSYRELHQEVCRLANVLIGFGIKKGDAVGLYMPMLPEVVISLLSCLKIGAVIVPIFSGFGPDAVSSRLNDCKAKVLIVADEVSRRGKKTCVKNFADQALAVVPSIEKMLVLRHTGGPVAWQEGRDVWWHEVVPHSSDLCETLSLDSEHPSMILYTSGTTGRPKGCVHTHAGALAQIAKEVTYYFDVKPRDRFFWFTDIGWMMGPWEIIGTLFNGACVVLYEGVPDYPRPDRLWKFLEDHQVTHLGISPTLVRLMRKYAEGWLRNYSLKHLRVLGSTGEPWDEESYLWFFHHVGKKRCPIINISGGTELVGCLLAPLPITDLKPCTLRGPGLGMAVDVFDEEGKSVRNEVGYLVCKKPFPSMTRGFLNDPDRYVETYFSKWKNVWNHGDWARIDQDGFWFLQGRADDTIKIAGKRVGPAEVEAALLQNSNVLEAAAIGVPDPLKGEVLVCFVVLKDAEKKSEALAAELKEIVIRVLGKSLAPKEIYYVSALPKTRSGKIVRGAVRKRFLGQEIANLSSIENPQALDEIPTNGNGGKVGVGLQNVSDTKL